ncbi:hypothetical protein AVEN_44826-1 [Araneus ventricosus]|uniref:Uncharacterized protein n=1 Tax=Araneus ventricosus TaxID=182803 RepID=A0A4Y2CL84_ARAVE|nr:hypothetical protein AVEN_44826-1 [Araneus ventricosus]
MLRSVTYCCSLLLKAIVGANIDHSGLKSPRGEKVSLKVRQIALVPRWPSGKISASGQEVLGLLPDFTEDPSHCMSVSHYTLNLTSWSTVSTNWCGAWRDASSGVILVIWPRFKITRSI